MGKIVKWCTNHAKFIVTAVVIVTVVFSILAIRVKVDASVDNLLPDSGKIRNFAVENNLALQEGYFVVGVEKPYNGYTVEILREFKTAIDSIVKLDAISSVMSPFNAVDFTSKGKRLITKPLLSGEAPKNKDELKLYLDGFIDNPMYKGQLVNDTGTMIMAVFPSKTLSNGAENFVRNVTTILEPLNKLTKVYMMGENVVYARVNHYLIRDMIILFALALSSMVISFYFGFGFRTKRAVFIPLSVVLIGIVWSLGFMGIVGWDLTIISICMPILVLSIGSSYAIHFLSQFFKDYSMFASGKATKPEWIAYSGERINKTIVLAALTTIIGFLMLLFTSVSQTREFGYATSFGIFTCMVLSLTYIPAVLKLTKDPKIPKEKMHKKMGGSLSDASAAIGKFVVKTRYMFVIVFAIIIVLYFTLKPYIKTQSDYFSYFPKKDTVINDMTHLIGETGGYQMLNITLTSDKDRYFLQPENLNMIYNTEKKLLQQPNITSAISFASYIANIHKRAYNKEETFESKGEINFMYRLLLNAKNIEGTDSILKNLIDQDGKRITLSLKVYNSEINRPISEVELQKMYDELRNNFDNLGRKNNLQINIWSTDLRFLGLTQTLNHDQMVSMGLSIIVLFVIMALAFKNIKAAIIALVPLISCILMNPLSMVATRIPQDITTMLVGSIAIGVAVDNAIHYMLNYIRSRKSGMEVEEAIVETHRYTGRPIMHTTLSVVGGLVFLSFSSYKAIAFFGILICLTLLFAMITTLTFMPSFIMLDYRFKRLINNLRDKRKNKKDK